MNKPALVIMAAGMGSRFGGLKQITPVDDKGHIIIDFSVYDAILSGFSRIVFVIKPENEADFRSSVGARFEGKIPVYYAYQTTDRIPEGFAVPEGRTRPWGTAHAVLCAEEYVPGDFAVINSDDFYGRDAIGRIAEFLQQPGGESDHAMVAYDLSNTLTENGSVNRGVCTLTDGKWLATITERLGIFACPGGGKLEIDGEEAFLPADTPVSMNLFGFRHSIFAALREAFEQFLQEEVPANPMKAECYLPAVPNDLIARGLARMEVLSTTSRWYGVTYREDLPEVQAAIARMEADGTYPVDM